MDKIKKVFESEIRGIDEKNMELTAVVSTAAVDRYRESIDPGGMDARNYRKNPVVLWAHNYDIPPIGKALWIKKDGEFVVSKVKFADTEMGREVFGLYRDGFMKAFSIGFIPVEIEDGDMDNPKSPRRIFRKWELLEYSAVPIPANPEALTLCVKRGWINEEKAKSIQEKDFDFNEFSYEDDVGEEKEQKKEENKFYELMGEIESLEGEKVDLIESINSKDSEIISLKLTIFNQQKTIESLKKKPGITADELGERIVEVAGGVIRKHLGAVK